MYEVAPAAVAAVSFLCEGVASLCFVGSIVFHIDPQLLESMRELALAPIRAKSLFHEIFTEGALGLGATPTICVMGITAEAVSLKINVFTLSRCLRL